jgi:hypothetical protein
MDIEPLRSAMPQVPEELSRIVMKCLEKDKDLRYQSVSSLSAELVAFKKEFKFAFDTSDLVNFMRKKFKENGKSGSKQ